MIWYRNVLIGIYKHVSLTDTKMLNSFFQYKVVLIRNYKHVLLILLIWISMHNINLVATDTKLVVFDLIQKCTDWNLQTCVLNWHKNAKFIFQYKVVLIRNYKHVLLILLIWKSMHNFNLVLLTQTCNSDQNLQKCY